MIYFKIYDTTMTLIAEGSVGTGLIAPGVRQGGITMPMAWYGSYTITDFGTGKGTLTQQS